MNLAAEEKGFDNDASRSQRASAPVSKLGSDEVQIPRFNHGMKGVKIEEEKVIMQPSEGNCCDWSEFKSEPN